MDSDSVHYVSSVTQPPPQAGSLSSEIPSTGWYSPGMAVTTSYSSFNYENPYVTPQPSSITSFSPMPERFKPTDTATTGYVRTQPLCYSPVAEFSKFPEGGLCGTTPPTENPYIEIPKAQDASFMYGFVHVDNSSGMLPARPRSSPSTFSPSAEGRVDNWSWAANPLGITAPDFNPSAFTGSTYPPPIPPKSPMKSDSAVPSIATPQPRRPYAPIAPNPNSLQRMAQRKRARDQEGSPDVGKRRKRSESVAIPMELGEEDRLLLKLKEEDGMPWKDIAAKFQADLGKTYQIPALQMRLKRLRERLRVWSEADLQALRLAHEYWIQHKFEIIAGKMLEFGATEKWTSRQCARKWHEIDPGPTPYTTYDQPTPAYTTYTTSPVETPALHPFMQFP